MADVKGLAEAQRRAAEETRIADLKEVMATRAGRRFVWSILAEAGTFRLSFNTNFGVTSFSEGQRSIGTGLYADVHLHCFEEYQEMEREARAAETTLQSLEQHEDN